MKATVRLLWLLPALCLVLSGCSAATESMMDTGYKSENGMLYMDAADMEAEEWTADKSMAATTASGGSAGGLTGENDLASRKLIRDANLNVETKMYDDFAAALEKQIAACGGYVQSGENTGSAERGNRWASYTIRVPESQYTAFLSSVSSLGTVTYRSENVMDVTMEYTDVEARIRALETEHDTLLAILEKCEILEDVITVQSRITEVQYELDSYKSRMRRYDDLIAYCTVYLNVSEVEKVTVPVAEQTLGERIAEDLAENCEDIVDDAENFAVWFVSSLPYFGIWLVILGAVVLFVIKMRKRTQKKWEERKQKRAENNAQSGSAQSDKESREE